MSNPQTQFRVSIDAFDGPLDLLLYLVRRAEVDIHDIPIAKITDEYLGVLQLGISVDVEMAGEFLVMAATLIEIKSRSLVPPEELDEEDVETATEDDNLDPRGDLIRQLLAFQRIRTASEELESHRIAFEQRSNIMIATPSEPVEEKEHTLELDDVHILDLSDAYEHIASSIDFSRLGGMRVVIDDIPIELCQEDLLDRLAREQSSNITLQSTFEGLSAQERVGMFLATLELVRLRKVSVLQDETTDEIVIALLQEHVTQDELTDEVK